MKNYIISGQVNSYRIKINLFATSPSSAINVFKNKYPNAEDEEDPSAPPVPKLDHALFAYNSIPPVVSL